jgi:hypothetical protein
MILGQENMAALADEIARELSAEMGVSLQAAKDAASGVLGTGGYKSGGTGALDGTGEGNQFVTDMTAAVAARVTAFQASGANSGQAWGVGFLGVVQENVPLTLIDMLVVLITPGVKKKLNEDAGRQGAK